MTAPNDSPDTPAELKEAIRTASPDPDIQQVRDFVESYGEIEYQTLTAVLEDVTTYETIETSMKVFDTAYRNGHITNPPSEEPGWRLRYDPFTDDFAPVGDEKQVPVITEVLDAFRVRDVVRTGGLLASQWDDQLYSRMDDEQTCFIQIDHSEEAEVSHELNRAIERYQEVTTCHQNNEEGIGYELQTDLGERAADAAETILRTTGENTEGTEYERIDVRDVLLLIGVGTDLELVDLQAARSDSGSDKHPSENKNLFGDFGEIVGVCSYHRQFTTCNDPFVIRERTGTGEQIKKAEYNKGAAQPKVIPDYLDGAAVTLSTTPPVPEENRTWGG